MAGEDQNGIAARIARIDERTENQERWLREFMVRTEKRQDKSDERLDKHDDRLGAVEKEQARQGVYSGIIATFVGGIVGAVTGFFGPRP